MKKSSLIMLGLCVTMLAGCGTSEQLSQLEEVTVEGNTVVDTEVPEVEVIEEEDNTVVYDESVKQSLEDYLSRYTYIAFIQEVENGVVDGINYSTSTYSITADVINNRYDMTFTFSTDDEGDIESRQFHIFEDINTDYMYSENLDTDTWSEADGDYSIVSWDISSFESDLDVWNYLLRDKLLEVGTTGEVSGGYWYFETTSEATDDMVTGLTYDSLGNSTLTYTFKEYNGVVIPNIFTQYINYYVGENEYYVKCTIKFDSFGNAELAVPEITAVEE